MPLSARIFFYTFSVFFYVFSLGRVRLRTGQTEEGWYAYFVREK